MPDPLILPLDWFVSYEPPWLDVALMLAGAALLAAMYAVYSQNDTALMGGLIVLTVAAALPWAVVNRRIAIVLLSFTGTWFQAVGTVRGYLKLKYYATKVPGMVRSALGRVRYRLRQLTGSSTPSHHPAHTSGGGLQSTAQTIGWWTVFQLLGLLAIITSVWVGVGLTTVGPLTIPTLTTDVVITWTLLTMFGGLLGLGWRFWAVRDAFPTTGLVGVLLIAVGAELHNFQALETEIAVFLASKVIYVLGFLGAVAVVILNRTEPAGQVRSK